MWVCVHCPLTLSPFPPLMQNTSSSRHIKKEVLTKQTPGVMKHDIGGIHPFVFLVDEAQNNEGYYGNHYHRFNVPSALHLHKGLSSTQLSGKHSSPIPVVISQQSGSAISYLAFWVLYELGNSTLQHLQAVWTNSIILNQTGTHAWIYWVHHIRLIHASFWPACLLLSCFPLWYFWHFFFQVSYSSTSTYRRMSCFNNTQSLNSLFSAGARPMAFVV